MVSDTPEGCCSPAEVVQAARASIIAVIRDVSRIPAMVVADYRLGLVYPSESRFTILFVCTGNQCRSALAEVITRSLTEGLPVEVSSAGTDVLGSVPSPKRTLKAASKLGYDLGEHRSRPLADADLDSAGLVVGFEVPHVATAVIERGADRSRTWLLPQLVRALEGGPAGTQRSSGDLIAGARSRLSRAAERRSSAPPMMGDQIADPIGRSARTHESTARTIDDLCRRMVAGLFRATGAVDEQPRR